MENETNAAAAGPNTPAIEPAAAAAPVVVEQPAPPKPLFRLNLDHDGVYWGAIEIHPEDYKDGDITLDHAPDNPLGRYKWNGVLGQMEALPASQIKAAPEAPSLEQAFHHLVRSLEEAGHAMPPVVAAWRDEFTRTVEQVWSKI